MRRRTASRVRKNPLEIDLFERFSQTPEATETDTTETDSTFDPTEPVEMREMPRKALVTMLGPSSSDPSLEFIHP